MGLERTSSNRFHFLLFFFFFFFFFAIETEDDVAEVLRDTICIGRHRLHHPSQVLSKQRQCHGHSASKQASRCMLWQVPRLFSRLSMLHRMLLRSSSSV